MIYSSADKGHYLKVAKYCIDTKHKGASVEGSYLEIKENSCVDLVTGSTRTTLDLPADILNLIVNVLRPVDVVFMKYRLYVENDKLWIKFYVNKVYLDKLALAYCPAPTVLSSVIKHVPETETPDYCTSDIVPHVNVTPEAEYCTRYLKLEPYAYQYNNIQWLRHIESNIQKDLHHLDYIIYKDLVHMKNSRFDIYMDKCTRILYNHDSIWKCDNRTRRQKFYGGVLCDEVGLGKTLSMVGLILSDKYRHEAQAAAAVPKRTSKVVSSRPLAPVPKMSGGKVVIKVRTRPTTSSEPEPQSEREPEPPSTVEAKAKVKVKVRAKPRSRPLTPEPEPKPESESNPNHRPDPNPEVTSEATLVMCPRRLVGQWIDEIHKYTSKLSVIEMSTMNHVHKYTYGDMCHVDIVVGSFSLLNNKSYYTQDGFRLHKIKWRRVIIDEGHEVLLHANKKRVADLRISTAIFSIPSTFRWVCTGTPLPFESSSLQAIISFLSGLGHNELSPLLSNIPIEGYKSLLELIFHLNTKKSIKTQISIPPAETHVEFLDFTKTEQAVYDSISPDDTLRQLQVCTNINVSKQDSDIVGGIVLNLNQVTKAMGEYHRNLCEQHEANIAATEEKINGLEEDLEAQTEAYDIIIGDTTADIKKCTDKDMLVELRELLSDQKEELKKIKTRIKGRIKTAKALLDRLHVSLMDSQKQVQTFRAIDSSHIGDATCPILGSKLDTGMVAITPDGHYYSQAGLALLFGNKKTTTCPLTKKPLDLSSLLIVDPSTMNSGSETETEPGSNIDMMRSKWGTKMSHVINKLQELFDEDNTCRVVIFSQWDKMLMLMGHALTDNHIKHVFCKGNVNVMKKAIRSFKSDESVKVILLSSESCSSGSNLTEANRVFLLDAVDGDVQQARAIEEQAIGRVKRLGQKRTVHVHRFVMANTIEETYYHKVYGN